MKKAGAFVVFLMLVMLAGCFSVDRAETVADDPTALIGLYSLKPLDPLMITLLGIPKETVIETTVDEYGQITLPYISDPIEVVGLSTSALEREIQRIYTEGEIYRNITVNIQTTAKTYFMEGEIARPMEYNLNRRITLLQAIAAASGYTEYADKKDITIIRRGEIIKVNAKEIEKHPEMDIQIEAGDRIKVDRTFY